MKVFRSTLKFYENVGVYEPKPNEPFHWLNWRNSLYLIYGFCLTLFTGIFFFHEAQTINEYSDSFYGFSSAIVSVLTLPVLYWHTQLIYELLEKMENFIQMRTFSSFRVAKHVKVFFSHF